VTEQLRPSTGSGRWTEPEPELVAPGVHRVPLPLPGDSLRAVNVYVLEEADGLVLVDGGWDVPEARAALDDGLTLLGATVYDVRRVLVTHVHRDHYTLGAAIGRQTGARVGLGLHERENVRLLLEKTRQPFSPQLQRLRDLGDSDLARRLQRDPAVRDVVEDVWSPPHDWLTEGPLILDGGRSLDVVETPGHTAGHVVFHDLENRLLFAGDHVLPTITPSLGLELAPPANPLGDFLASLAIVRSRPDAMLLPAHGGVASSVHTRVDQLVEHHDRRLDEILMRASGAGVTAREVAVQLRWTRKDWRLDELDVFNEMLAVLETAAHLDLLVAQNRLERQVTSEGFRFA
jgi:glyoxylase-like metal-dependent hydrolase (beta-lactamase superfamily II)